MAYNVVSAAHPVGSVALGQHSIAAAKLSRPQWHTRSVLASVNARNTESLAYSQKTTRSGRPHGHGCGPLGCGLGS